MASVDQGASQRRAAMTADTPMEQTATVAPVGSRGQSYAVPNLGTLDARNSPPSGVPGAMGLRGLVRTELLGTKTPIVAGAGITGTTGTTGATPTTTWYKLRAYDAAHTPYTWVSTEISYTGAPIPASPPYGAITVLLVWNA